MVPLSKIQTKEIMVYILNQCIFKVSSQGGLYMTDFIKELVEEMSGINLNGVSDSIISAMGVIILLLVIVSIFAFIVSAILAIAYIKYNHKQASCHKTGEQVARKILDQNDLRHIKVSKSGSIMFGNIYSHYFKKVRLRRLTWKRDSLTSLSMAAQKASLAILDKEGDPDMKARVRMTPVIYFGPLAFVPLIIIGALLDIFVLKNPSCICMIICSILGLIIYIVSFIMSILVLKTEKKAQVKAIEIMKTTGLATDEEIEMSKKLFRLYNIEYINDMVIALLELIYRILQIIAYVQNSSAASNRS